MRKALLLLLALVAVSVAPPTSAAQIAGGGAGATPVRVPFTLDGHLPAFDVKINGQGPFRVSLDTGMGGQLSVGRELAETLKLQKVGEARIADPSGQNASSRDLVRVDSVDIGGMQFKGLEATVRDGERPDRTAVAMLGYELFKDVLLTLDYRKGEIAIARGTLPRPDGKEVLALVKGHPVPVIELTLGGKKVLTDIDAGSPALLTVPLAVSKELALKGEPQIVGHGRTASGPMDILAAELAGDVTIGPRTLHDPRLDIIERFPRANLGYRFLRDLAVTFDTKHGRVAFR